MKEEQTNKIDFSSVSKPIEFIDNYSNHATTASDPTYRITTQAHNRESSGTLEKRVDKIMPSLFDLKTGIKDGETITSHVKLESGTSIIAITRESNSLRAVTNSANNTNGSSVLCVPVGQHLLNHVNAYGEHADELKTIYLILIRFLNLPFRSRLVKNEETHFKKLINLLWQS